MFFIKIKNVICLHYNKKILNLHRIYLFLKIYLQFFHNEERIYVLYCKILNKYTIFWRKTINIIYDLYL